MRSSRMRKQQAFTLIEVLVVVAIIALLVAILLPSLSQARKQAKSVACASNLHHVGQAFAIYLAKYRFFPASYLYANDDRGNYDVTNQLPSSKKFYLHWSYFLYEKGKVDNKAFQCPEYAYGGNPRTNPGRKGDNWNSGQVDDFGSSGPPGGAEDRQAERMSYAANTAIITRNKFDIQASVADNGGQRTNHFVSESQVKRSGDTILATEYFNSPVAIAAADGGGAGDLIKSHRPINPFYNISTGANELQAPPNAYFRYTVTPVLSGQQPTAANYGIQPLASIANVKGLIDGAVSSQLNAVGRHHPGGDSTYGGTANFLHCDGSVVRTTVLNSLKRRGWGDRFYSLSGNTDVK